MKIVYSGLKFYESVGTDEYSQIAFYDGYNYHAPDNILSFAEETDFDKKENQGIYNFINGVCWERPTRINPTQYSDGRVIDPGDPNAWEEIKNTFGWIARRIIRFLDRSVYFSKEDEYNAVIVNFVFNSYYKNVFEYAPRIIFTGSTDSGKSRVQDILGLLCYHGYTIARPTFATLFRMIDLFDITPIIDEVQKLKPDVKADVMDIFLNGDRKGKKVPRINPNSLKPESFRIYGPMAISNKAGGFLTEDIENRAITIKMIENTKKDLDVLLDKAELEIIRNDLYSLFSLYMIHPECFKMDELFKESIIHLSGKKENDIRVCDFLGAYPYAEKLRNRARDIATTYYTLSRLTNTEEETLKILSEEQQYSKEILKETTEAHIFSSFAKCCYNLFVENPLLTFDGIIREVCMKNVTESYNEDLKEAGNKTSFSDEIKSNKVTRTMRDMGFNIRRGNNNLSYLDWTKETNNAIDVNLTKFGSDEEEKIFSVIRKRGIGTNANFKVNTKTEDNTKLTNHSQHVKKEVES